MADDNSPPIDLTPPATQPKTMVGLNWQSTIGSPFFWLLIGAAGMWWICRDAKKGHKAAPSIRPGVGSFTDI